MGLARSLRCALLLLLLQSAPTFPVAAEEAEPERAERVEIEARRFRFTPARIKVDEGTRLEIELESRDVEHGFEIVGTGLETRVPPRGGGTVRVVFEATKAGRYPFRCSHKCGAGHETMRGLIVVEKVE